MQGVRGAAAASREKPCSFVVARAGAGLAGLAGQQPGQPWLSKNETTADLNQPLATDCFATIHLAARQGAESTVPPARLWPAGNAVLRQFVQRLASTIRPYDAIGRYGGEEFLLVLPGQSGSHATERPLVARTHAAISTQPMQLDAQTTLVVTCSFGVAFALPGDSASAAVILDRADQALCRAKRAGRDRMEFAAA